MKRRSIQPRKLRDRRAGKSPYARHGKKEFKYAGTLVARGLKEAEPGHDEE